MYNSWKRFETLWNVSNRFQEFQILANVLKRFKTFRNVSERFETISTSCFFQNRFETFPRISLLTNVSKRFISLLILKAFRNVSKNFTFAKRFETFPRNLKSCWKKGGWHEGPYRECVSVSGHLKYECVSVSASFQFEFVTWYFQQLYIIILKEKLFDENMLKFLSRGGLLHHMKIFIYKFKLSSNFFHEKKALIFPYRTLTSDFSYLLLSRRYFVLKIKYM